MKITLIILINLALFCRPLAAQPTIIVKGLTGQSVILSVDGQLLILKKGIKQKNMTLLSNDHQYATMRIGSKKVRLKLDDTIAQSYGKSANKKANKKAITKVLFKESLYHRLKKSRITELMLVEKNHKSIKLKANYFYTGEHGDNADIAVSLIKNGKASKNSKRQYHRLEIGENTLDLSFDMKDSKQIVYYTEAINFAFLGRKENTFTFYTKTIPLKKYWNRVDMR